jgi:hypothetical protein
MRLWINEGVPGCAVGTIEWERKPWFYHPTISAPFGLLSWNSVLCRRTFPARLLAEVSGYLSTVYIGLPTHEHIALLNNQGGLWVTTV